MYLADDEPVPLSMRSAAQVRLHGRDCPRVRPGCRRPRGASHKPEAARLAPAGGNCPPARPYAVRVFAFAIQSRPRSSSEAVRREIHMRRRSATNPLGSSSSAVTV